MGDRQAKSFHLLSGFAQTLAPLVELLLLTFGVTIFGIKPHLQSEANLMCMVLKQALSESIGLAQFGCHDLRIHQRLQFAYHQMASLRSNNLAIKSYEEYQQIRPYSSNGSGMHGNIKTANALLEKNNSHMNC
jgi:hypothetical protein